MLKKRRGRSASIFHIIKSRCTVYMYTFYEAQTCTRITNVYIARSKALFTLKFASPLFAGWNEVYWWWIQKRLSFNNIEIDLYRKIKSEIEHQQYSRCNVYFWDGFRFKTLYRINADQLQHSSTLTRYRFKLWFLGYAFQLKLNSFET